MLSNARSVSLYLLIIVTGFYAGLHFTTMMNPSVLGIMDSSGRLMPSVQWAVGWQITDGFMGARMKIFGPILQLTYIVNIVLFGMQWRQPIVWVVLAAYAVFCLDVYFTLQYQIPINQYIQSLDFDQLTREQMQHLSKLHPQVIANFKKRETWAIFSFAIIALTAFLKR